MLRKVIFLTMVLASAAQAQTHEDMLADGWEVIAGHYVRNVPLGFAECIDGRDPKRRILFNMRDLRTRILRDGAEMHVWDEYTQVMFVANATTAAGFRCMSKPF